MSIQDFLIDMHPKTQTAGEIVKFGEENADLKWRRLAKIVEVFPETSSEIRDIFKIIILFHIDVSCIFAIGKFFL